VTTAQGAWITVVACVRPADADVVSGLLWGAGVAGVEERQRAAEERVELRAGVPVELADAVILAVGDRAEVSLEPVDGDADLDRWREFARPWRAGGRLVVVPAWQSAPKWVGADDVVLSIDPGRAFGSGAHPTTRMCLSELERLVEPEAAVADVGCGSGVLAVAAAVQGAALVAAIDIDPEAVRATAENAERNGVSGVVAPSETPASQLEPGAYDLVVANIAAGTLVVLAPALVRAVADDGTVIVSGILEEQVPAVLAAFEVEGFVLGGTVADDDWRTLLVRRP
jgi:ribosomal protein L11 methyltransferase